ncbi:MAG: hypothetical protein R3C59_21630 [Planctomycetaceae bacterium]
MDNDAQASHATIFATAFPAVGKEAEWEQGIGELIRTSMSFPGHQSSTVLKPESAERPHYRVITKFDCVENMQRWYDSEERQQKVRQLAPFEDKAADIQQLTGFETWFTPPGQGSLATPPKYKMFVVVWMAVYLTVLPMIALLKPMTVSLHPWIVGGLLSAITVASMTWVTLPVLSWLFRRWLYTA